MGKFLVKYAFNRSEIVCLSNHHLKDIEPFAHNKIYIVANGIKIESEYLHLADEHNFRQGTIPRILFLSNLSRKKGIPELIGALNILKDRGYAFEASLVGSEWNMTFDEVKELITSADLQEIISIEGPKFGNEKFRYIVAADIFVFPTYFELFPGVILEAMQFGKAIVSTFEGSIPEIIDNHVNGILVEQQNTIALADGIAFMLNNPEKRLEMGLLAKQKFFKEFTLEAFERRMHSVFKEVITK